MTQQTTTKNTYAFTFMSYTLFGVVCLIACIYSAYSYAAYCSLRDPISAINTLYPNATHHRSITREVDRKSRDHVSKRLPFTLLFNELGKHTLYTIMKEQQPLGFIHARSELSDVGLIEIVWAINTDMTIKDSYFQRCRNRKCRDPIFINDMKTLINGKTFAELLNNMQQINYSDPTGASSTASLKIAAIKSALKTIAVTESVWGKDILLTQQQHMVNQTFKSTPKVTIIETPNNSKGITFNMINQDSVKTFEIESQKKIVGKMVYAQWEQYGYKGEFNWLFSPDGIVLDIQPVHTWPNTDIAHAFTLTVGKNVSNKNFCTTAIELAGEKLFRSTYIH